MNYYINFVGITNELSTLDDIEDNYKIKKNKCEDKFISKYEEIESIDAR